MIATATVPSHRLPTAKAERPGAVGVNIGGEVSPLNAMADTGSDSRFDIARRGGAIADKARLETVGWLLLLATLFFIGAGVFAVLHQLDDLSQIGARVTVQVGPPAAAVR